MKWHHVPPVRPLPVPVTSAGALPPSSRRTRWIRAHTRPAPPGELHGNCARSAIIAFFMGQNKTCSPPGKLPFLLHLPLPLCAFRTGGKWEETLESLHLRATLFIPEPKQLFTQRNAPKRFVDIWGCWRDREIQTRPGWCRLTVVLSSLCWTRTFLCLSVCWSVLSLCGWNWTTVTAALCVVNASKSSSFKEHWSWIQILTRRSGSVVVCLL